MSLYMTDYTMYCVICGGPIHELSYADLVSSTVSTFLSDNLMTRKGGSASRFWLTQAVLLYCEDKLVSEPVILELPAENSGGPNFELLESRKPIVACDNKIFYHDPPLYIPTHNACITVAKRVILLRGDNSLRRLWLVLKNRFHNSSNVGDFRHLGPICTVHPPDGWPGVGEYQEVQWQPSEELDDDLTMDRPSEVS
ncbi:hypothetical protein N7G274_002238 [Stereocaulon virgatum]|uniref:Uncharacterized protein n=1 Tax=Stereocaulon virgatum TaxID=373712 RepID=A0ABR4AHB5_9LECA